MSMFSLYVLLVLIPNFANTAYWFTFVSVLIGIGSIIIVIAGIDEKKESWFNSGKKWLKFSVVCFLVSVTLGNATPSKEDVAVIVAGSYLTQIEGMNEMPENIVKSLNTLFKQYANLETLEVVGGEIKEVTQEAKDVALDSIKTVNELKKELDK